MGGQKGVHPKHLQRQKYELQGGFALQLIHEDNLYHSIFRDGNMEYPMRASDI